MNENKSTQKLVFLSLMVSVALVLHVMESSFPALSFIAPGLRLGLANIISVVMIYRFKIPEAFSVLLIRIAMSSLFGGGFTVFLYSLSGGILSFVVMLLFEKTRFLKLSVVAVSMMGAIFFNIGQLLVAGFIIHSFQIFFYLPVMGIASVLTGLFVGMVSKYVIERESLWKSLS